MRAVRPAHAADPPPGIKLGEVACRERVEEASLTSWKITVDQVSGEVLLGECRLRDICASPRGGLHADARVAAESKGGGR